MKKQLVTALLLFSQGLAADPAVYMDGSIFIDEGVSISDQGAAYFKDIVLTGDKTDGFKIVAAEPRNLAFISRISLEEGDSYPQELDVLIEGDLSTPCNELESIATARRDHSFHLVLAQKPVPEDTVCAQVLSPFNITVSLDLRGLLAGTYTVNVNGSTTGLEFILEADNIDN